MDKNLILEIGTEEIPARFMNAALADIAKYAEEEFAEARIEHGRIEVMGTPRRMVLTVRAVADRQADLSEEYKGPAWKNAFDGAGNPTRAALGFAKGKGINVEDLVKKEIKGVPYCFAVINHEGGASSGLLPEVMKNIISRLVFPKNMYWSTTTVRFARPVRWLLCLWGEDVVEFELAGLKSGRTTRGHRFMGASSITVKSESSYMSDMYDNSVIVDQNKREEKMRAAIATIEKELDGRVELDPEIVNENLYLVEYPVPFYGSFDKKYLEIPEEVLTTSMKDNQKYFAVYDHAGKLMPNFVGVSNNLTANMALVREGNERVLRARLEDAVFFWEEDLKKPLHSRVEGLKKVTYQEKLGSVYDKTMHMVSISRHLCEMLGLDDEIELVERAAYLSKTDLVTDMVGEFPELQGVMGRAYALKNGENERVALALQEQYMPTAAGNALPTDVIGAIVGIAERSFNMLGAYKLGLQPTGSRDPYGLRRAVRCMNELIWGLNLDIDLSELFAYTAELLEVDAEAVASLLAFVSDRTLVQLKERGYSHEMSEMAMAVTGTRLLQTLKLLEALGEVKNEEWFTSLVSSAVRVNNILAKAEKNDGRVSEDLFREDAESALHTAVMSVRTPVAVAMEKDDWNGLMNVLARLSPAVSAFFDDVMVMDEDPAVRANRIALLSLCNELFIQVGDLSKVK